MSICSYNVYWSLSDRLRLRSLRSCLYLVNINIIGFVKGEFGEREESKRYILGEMFIFRKECRVK